MNQRENIRVRIISQREEDDRSDMASLSVAERWTAMCQLARDAWAFRGDGIDESKFSRHALRVSRRTR